MIIFFRVLFIVTTILYSSIYYLDVSFTAAIIAGAISAVISLVLIIVIEYISHSYSSRMLLSAIIGLMVGIISSYLITLTISSLLIDLPLHQVEVIKAIIFHVISFAIMMFFVINNEDFLLFDKILNSGITGSQENEIYYKILDTSVIIDGRISDICDTSFIEGILVVPNFVLHELQMIADSADPIKRNRGRRGLDILNKMQKDQKISVTISDVDFPEIDEVDAKLVKLASVMKAKVLTNDFNLNKVAEFHGVQVLNINQLANALKPIVLPGEEMKVLLVKEGKDQHQAIGYLDDGTMIVVENGRRKLNSDVWVVVTSVLQTTAGRMIFSRLRE